MDPFKAHLATLLSIYEAETNGGGQIPEYEGPTDPQTAQILCSLDVLAKRMWSAEETVSQLQVTHDPSKQSKENVPDTKHHDKATDRLNRTEEHCCPTCGRFLSQDSVVELPDDFVLPPIPPQSHEEIAATEELRLLKAQISDVARVCNAVAQGDLTQRITVPAHGTVMVQLKDVVNTMVDKLERFKIDIAHSSEGFLTGTAGFCCGTLPRKCEPAWPELTGTINKVLSTFTLEVRVVAQLIKAVTRGDMTKQIKLEVEGEMLALNMIANDMVLWFGALDKELKRAVEEVETFGKLQTPAHVEHMDGIWLNVLNNFNRICSLLPDKTQVQQNNAPGEI